MFFIKFSYFRIRIFFNGNCHIHTFKNKTLSNWTRCWKRRENAITKWLRNWNCVTIFKKTLIKTNSQKQNGKGTLASPIWNVLPNWRGASTEEERAKWTKRQKESMKCDTKNMLLNSFKSLYKEEHTCLYISNNNMNKNIYHNNLNHKLTMWKLQ